MSKQTSLSGYPATPLTANSADITFTAAGASFADGAGFVMEGDDVLIVHNGNVAAQTITIQSVADTLNRKGDITTYSIGAGEYALFSFPKAAGWAQPSDGKLYFAVTAADVEFAAIHINR